MQKFEGHVESTDRVKLAPLSYVTPNERHPP